MGDTPRPRSFWAPLMMLSSSLPVGTEVKVTRIDPNESVTVEINDRKPYKEGTLIDLARGAAEALDLDDDGNAQVRIAYWIEMMLI